MQFAKVGEQKGLLGKEMCQKNKKMGVFGYFEGTESGNFNTNTPPKTSI